MLTTVARTIAGTSLMAAVIGLSALGAGVANATPELKTYNVCYSYDYSTQVFYDCV